MNVRAANWHDEMLKFRSRMKNIEIVLTNLINGMFDTTNNVEDCIQAYAVLYYYSKRDSLKPLFDKKVKRVCKTY